MMATIIWVVIGLLGGIGGLLGLLLLNDYLVNRHVQAESGEEFPEPAMSRVSPFPNRKREWAALALGLVSTAILLYVEAGWA